MKSIQYFCQKLHHRCLTDFWKYGVKVGPGLQVARPREPGISDPGPPLNLKRGPETHHPHSPPIRFKSGTPEPLSK